MYLYRTHDKDTHSRTQIGGPYQHPAPKLESLSLCYYETSYSWDRLLDVLKERHDYSHSLRELVLRSCPIGEDEDVLKIKELAEVRWGGVEGVGSDKGVVGEDSDPERGYDPGADNDVCKEYYEDMYYG